MGRVPLFRVTSSISPGTDCPLSEGRSRPFFEGRLPHFRVRFTTLPRNGNPYTDGRVPFSERWVPFYGGRVPFSYGRGPLSEGRYTQFPRAPFPISEGRGTPCPRGGRPSREGRSALFLGTGAPYPMDGYPFFEGRGGPPVPRHGNRRPCDDRLFRGTGTRCRGPCTLYPRAGCGFPSNGYRFVRGTGSPFPRDGYIYPLF